MMLVLVALGIFCGVITFVLFISMQLMKKLLRRMERINTFLQLQSLFIAVLGLGLLIMVGTSINFNNVNQSSIVKDAIPLKFHDRYQLAAAALIAISLFSFVASFYEIPALFTITNLLCTIVIIGLVLISIGNQVTSNEIADKLDNKCVFVLPHFSQDLLMSYGCSAKYKTFE